MRDRFKILQIVWTALMGGVLAFGVVALFLVTTGAIGMPGFPRVLLRVAGPVAVAIMGSAFLVRRKLLEAIPASARAEERLARYHAAVIVGLAVIEGPGLFLIVLGMITGSTAFIVGGCGAALLLMFIARPTREEAGIGLTDR